jgi:hypothetical protein
MTNLKTKPRQQSQTPSWWRAFSFPNSHSIDFEDPGQYAYITDAGQSGLDLVAPMTIAGWFRVENFPGTPYTDFAFVGKTNAGTNNRQYSFSYEDNSGNNIVWFTNNAGTNGGSNRSAKWAKTLSVDTWYHIALVVTDGSTIELFIDGVSEGAPDSGTWHASPYDGSAEFRVGGYNGGNTWDGLIDDVRVWSRALSSSEISDLYNSPESFSNSTSTQAWWKFNSSYSDSSANGNTLTGNGSPVFTTDVPFANDFSSTTSDSYTYGEIGHSNPHAPTQVVLGEATSTYIYDNNGNITSATGTASTTFGWDYGKYFF